MNQLITLFILMAVMTGCTQTARQEAGDRPKMESAIDSSALKSIELKVEGMTCEGCEQAINNSVTSLKGVASVTSSHKEAFTRVRFDTTKTDVHAIREKISDAGYDPGEGIKK